jgi:ubiquitin-like protein Pup
LRDRLDSRLGLLRSSERDVRKRQQTLRATIEWSYQMLEPQVPVHLRSSVGRPGSHPRSSEGRMVTSGHVADPVRGRYLYVRRERAMRRETERRRYVHRDRTPERIEANGTASVRDDLEHELDEILDEIDQVLEENAEEFVKAFVQKGGE